jgi:hypothetical protein
VESHNNIAGVKFGMDNLTINFLLPGMPDRPRKIVDKVENVDKW